MARKHRTDYEMAWWHLFNRGVAKRTLFETARDIEVFLDLLGEVVDRNWIEVHAFSVLTTHFHLMVRSVHGGVSQSLQRVGQKYSRWFNRTRKRDGPLFRGRFGGRLIEDGVYWEIVQRYIDLNAPRAGLCDVPSQYPFGSARTYVHGTGPSWLKRDDVEAALAAYSSGDAFRPEDYDAHVMSSDASFDAHLVETLIARPSTPTPRFGDLVRTTSAHQAGWMEWKTALADGTRPGAAFLSPDAARRAAEAAARALDLRPRVRGRSNYGRDLRIALLHSAAGLRAGDVAEREGISRSAVRDALRRHRVRLDDNPRYDEYVCRVLRSTVRRTLALGRHPPAIPARIDIGGAEPLVVDG